MFVVTLLPIILPGGGANVYVSMCSGEWLPLLLALAILIN